ncbi:DUF3685 domain-containing protein [Synechocystis sp. LKSZ1]|uniref:DUF3685 domain-containing protein n=1 Tax=Synechocystis sp. LKSZ1 TaxID=3144951 RepID=UPI00336BD29D
MSDRPLTLLVIDEDAVFRLGLVTALLNYPQFQVLAQMSRVTEAAANWLSTLPDLIILDPLVLTEPVAGWEQCWFLRRTYPSLKICLLTASLEYEQLLRARNLGIEGYFPKGTPMAELTAGFSEIHQGGLCWANPQGLPTYQALSPAQQWLWRGFRGGLEQIESQRQALQQASQQPSLSAFDALFLQGRRRELRLAQQIVETLMPAKLRRLHQVQAAQWGDSPSETRPASLGTYGPIALIPLSAKLGEGERLIPQFNGQNLTPIPLALDALNPNQRQVLLALAWQKFQDTLEQLRSLNIRPEQLPQEPSSLLAEIWQGVTLSFLGPHLNPQEGWQLDQLQGLLESYKPIIQRESLGTIPRAQAVLEQFLLAPVAEGPGPTDTVSWPWELYQANLIIQIANGAMTFTLNYFSESETIKKALYVSKLLSSREIARFRNNLAWYYRLSQYWLEPKQIFESQHTLLYFTPQGITCQPVYAPRQNELEQLQGLPWLVTVLLELRDAASPRLQAIVRFLGHGLVFFLTQVIGRAAGLVVKGVLQGIGNTWQENRYRPQPNQEKSNP